MHANKMVKVKICGITNLEDGLGAAEAGADALGFIFYRGSSRHIDPERAAEIIGALPPLVSKVGVFVNSEEGEVRRIAECCGLDVLQFHGDESPSFCGRFRPRAVIKAFRVRGEEGLAEMERFEVGGWLLDSFVPGQLGGSGIVFNWAIAREAARRKTWTLLAGGLTPGNVAAAIQEAQPYGVDVSSGVELSPGRKDLGKVREFIEAVRGAERR